MPWSNQSYRRGTSRPCGAKEPPWRAALPAAALFRCTTQESRNFVFPIRKYSLRSWPRPKAAHFSAQGAVGNNCSSSRITRSPGRAFALSHNGYRPVGIAGNHYRPINALLFGRPILPPRREPPSDFPTRTRNRHNRERGDTPDASGRHRCGRPGGGSGSRRLPLYRA
uniref:Uncharacterized protein n=1 Tax=Candidatus Kentrum sp. DK TaxID=2126562 RepID=A0A450SW82_9GAMM|nr:MAG: hypothetical protein BECKDK2373C_GA0170839_10646 [Candidatus Kentron sp. DK]